MHFQIPGDFIVRHALVSWREMHLVNADAVIEVPAMRRDE
jgi:hypothetical protein